jgi:hypothetical protein
MGKYLPWEAPFDDSTDRVDDGAHPLVRVCHSGRVRSIETLLTLDPSSLQVFANDHRQRLAVEAMEGGDGVVPPG